MKILRTISISAIAFLLISMNSCKDDDPFTQVTAFEYQLFMMINDYRTEKAVSDIVINYDTMLPEAQFYSAKMAAGDIAVSTAGLTSSWTTIHDHWGGTNDASAVLMYPLEGSSGITTDMIFNAMTADSAINQVLLADVSICGVGIATDTTGNAYVTYLAMLVE